jgi:NAD(P)-dependent dehydrogenase (short-subunit alcohol dehydrogenase family)
MFSITGRRQKELDVAVSDIGKNVIGIQGNVSNLADLNRLYSVVKDKKDHLDILFANAGVGEFAQLGEISEEHFDKIFNINVKGVLFTVQKALPLFQNDGGSIILNTSIAASKGLEAFSVYYASKAAIRSFARTWTMDLKDRKIRVNAISPGPIDTTGVNSLAQGEKEINQLKKTLISAVPMGRMGSPDEIPKVVTFLASDESNFVTSIDLSVDGGMAPV